MKLGRPTYFFIFAVSIFALSQVFAALRDLWQSTGSMEIFRFVLSLGFFIALFLLLGFFTYETEKGRGKVTRKVGMYEWLESKGFSYGK